jgi:hypothetical protein
MERAWATAAESRKRPARAMVQSMQSGLHRFHAFHTLFRIARPALVKAASIG